MYLPAMPTAGKPAGRLKAFSLIHPSYFACKAKINQPMAAPWV